MLEFFKQPGVYEASLFFLGILMHKLMSLAFAIKHMAKYYKEVGVSSFGIMITTYIMALASLDEKEKLLRNAGMDEKVIKIAIESDKKDIDQWRDRSLKSLYDFAPKVFGSIKEDFEKE